MSKHCSGIQIDCFISNLKSVYNIHIQFDFMNTYYIFMSLPVAMSLQAHTSEQCKLHIKCRCNIKVIQYIIR